MPKFSYICADIKILTMTYNFDTIIPRRGTNCEKWDSMPNSEVLPMWVADMDFRTAQPIVDALQRRVAHGIFGYTRVPDEYYTAVSNWFSRRHGWNIRREEVIYTSGVVPAISAILKALTRPGDGVLVQGPVYNCFYSSIRNSGCMCISNPLVLEGNTYRMDYEDLEQKASDPRTRVLLLCNPHNPAGRVWTPEELKRVGDICHRHDVTVVSDEIHCELTMPGHTYTPFLSLDEEWTSRAIACISPSKAFNIAGLQIANIVTPDPDLYRRINRAINDNEVCDVNPFGVLATIAAYNEGEEWLDQLLHYLHGNYTCMAEFCREHLPQFPLVKLEGTYLVWMDCRATGMPSQELNDRLVEEAKLCLNPGAMYGPEGEGFLRWNIACPRSVLREGLERFQRFAQSMER